MLKLDMEKMPLSNITYRVMTPDGEMFVSLLEKDEKVCGIDIKIGKTGSSLVAWAHTLGRILTMCIEKGATISELMEELSMQTSDRISLLPAGTQVRSGAEGIWIALLDYSKDRHNMLKKQMNINDDDVDDLEEVKEKKGKFHHRSKLHRVK